MPAPLRFLSPLSTRPTLHLWLRRCLWALIGWSLLCLVVWLALPPLVHGPLERWASQALGREVRIGALHFRPWSLELTLQNLRVAGAAGAPDQLSIARLYIDGELQSLWRMAPVIDALRIESPHLRLTHLGDGHYDIDDIIDRLTSPASAASNSGPARVALYNLALAQGSVAFTDQSVERTHTVQDLALQLPFLSTLPSQREVKVEPHLSFSLNGSRFDSSAQGTPFAQTGTHQARLRLSALDLEPYLAYLPAQWPVRLQRARLDADVTVEFTQGAQQTVQLRGSVQASDVHLTERDGTELLALERLQLQLADVQPLARVLHLQSLTLTEPVLTVNRDRRGALRIVHWAAPKSADDSPTSAGALGPAPTAPAAPPDADEGNAAPAPHGSASAPAAAPPGWRIALDHSRVQNGRVRWNDDTTAPRTQLEATALQLDVTDLAWPSSAMAQVQGSLALARGTLGFRGQASVDQFDLDITAQQLALQTAMPYLAQALAPAPAPAVQGQLSTALNLRWRAAAPSALNPASAVTPPPAGLTVTAHTLSLDHVHVQEGRDTLVRWERLGLEGAEMALASRSVALNKLVWSRPHLLLERSTEGRWRWERWLPIAAPSAAGAANTSTGSSGPAPWQVQLNELSVDGAAVMLRDAAPERPVALDLSTLQLSARHLGTHSSTPQPLQLSARVALPAGQRGSRAEAGRLVYQGTLATVPRTLEGRVNLTRLPLHALDGYLAEHLNLALRRAHAGFRGRIALTLAEQNLALQIDGDAEIEDLRAHRTTPAAAPPTPPAGDELLSWKSLGLRGLQVRTAPGIAPRLAVQETSLVDFFARLDIDAQGQLNLQQVGRSTTPATTADPAPALASPVAAFNAAGDNAHTRAPTAALATASSSLPPSPAPELSFGPIHLINGRVLFSDHFVQPNYTARLSELTGTLSAFTSHAPPSASEPALAQLHVRGRAEDSASIEITGALHPLAQPPVLDITGKVRGLELPPLTPYTIKYAGHGIERGKLSMDVNYKVLPDGQLTATNRLVLEQLSFGDAVASAPHSLPVKLAVALLADRQGVIDLNLPISGSLNDPQFRMGPVIGRIVMNLITKAVTAPFSLLASALGGGQEMDHVVFAPGSASLSPEAQQTLDKVAQALAHRPALQVTVTGTANLEAEREGLQQGRLQKMVRAAKFRSEADDGSQISAQEYPQLLQSVYRRADFAKPRNLVGLSKALSVPEMEALLLAHQPATEAMAHALAQERGQAIRNYLASRQLPTERLFLAAPRTGTPSTSGAPRAELSLGMR